MVDNNLQKFAKKGVTVGGQQKLGQDVEFRGEYPREAFPGKATRELSIF